MSEELLPSQIEPKYSDYLSDDEARFRAFADDNYNVKNVKDEDAMGIIRRFAIYLVPWVKSPTWVEQDRRRRQWPWVMADLSERVFRQFHELKTKNAELQQQLIAAKKEISQLKRNKT
jgi:hypothetical protein